MLSVYAICAKFFATQTQLDLRIVKTLLAAGYFLGTGL